MLGRIEPLISSPEHVRRFQGSQRSKMTQLAHLWQRSNGKAPRFGSHQRAGTCSYGKDSVIVLDCTNSPTT